MNIQRRSTFVVGVVSITAFSFCSLFLQLNWIRSSLIFWKEQHPKGLGTLSHDEPELGVVLPLIADEMEHTIRSIQHWPAKCSAITSSRVDLIFYFAEELPLYLDRLLEDTSVSSSCFKTTKVVSADLHLRVRVRFI